MLGCEGFAEPQASGAKQNLDSLSRIPYGSEGLSGPQPGTPFQGVQRNPTTNEARVLIIKLKYVYNIVSKVSNKPNMELQTGTLVNNEAAMRVAMEIVRPTVSKRHWELMIQEMRRRGMKIPKRIKKDKKHIQKKNIENIVVENIAVEVEVEVEVDCPICCDHHPKTNCVTTSCGHCFGKDCFHLWAQTQQDKQTVVTCPLCVAPVLSLL